MYGSQYRNRKAEMRRIIDFIKRIISKFVKYKNIKITYLNGRYTVKGWLLTKKDKEEILKRIKIKINIKQSEGNDER